MDDCQVCHGSIEAISILDPLDVKEAYSHIASCYYAVQWHVRSHGWREVSFRQEEDSMEGRLVLRCEVSFTEALQIPRRSDSNDGHASQFPHTSLILSGNCDPLESGTREWILILRTRHPALHITKRPFWSMWRMNTVPNIDVYRSINSKRYRAAISSPLQRLQGLINHPLIHRICPAMMRNT